MGPMQPSNQCVFFGHRTITLSIGLALSLGHAAAQAFLGYPEQPPPAGLGPPALGGPKGMLTLRSMRVANSGPDGSLMHFGPNSEFIMGTDSAGNFLLKQASKVGPPVLFLDTQDTLHISSARVEALSVDTAGGISVAGVRQWQLLSSEDFMGTAPIGWSRSEVTQCAGVNMLGGFCKFSKTEVNKTFAGLPPHKQVRIVARYHFIDRWVGETGYMKLSVGQDDCPVTVWSEQHMQQEAKNGLNLCGNVETPEGKFSASIDVTVPHNKGTLSISFGSTMDDVDPCDQSWGVSGVEVYVRA